MIIKKRTKDFLARFSGEERFAKAAQFGYSRENVMAAFAGVQQEPVQTPVHNSYGDSEIDSMETLMAAANRHRIGTGKQPNPPVSDEPVEIGFCEISDMNSLVQQAARLRAAM